jgi:hypothetical protein
MCINLCGDNMTYQNRNFAALIEETRSVIPTNNAAFHLNRKDQTLRGWACHETGPIKPVRINGRLAWSVDEIRVLLKGGV